jgi:hypothetical protein
LGILGLAPEEVDTLDHIWAILVEVASADDPELDHLRVVAEHQGIPLEVRVLGGGS